MKDIEKYLITTSSSVFDAMKSLNDCGAGILVVVDDDSRLIGTVADGDIRRGLIAGLAFTESVTMVTNKNPKVVKNSEAIGINFGEILKNHTHVIPIIDDNNKVVDIYSATESIVEKKDNPVFIMAGGFGTRLYPLTENCPKPMLPVNGKPMLELIINKFKNAGFYKFYISTHFLPEVIRGHFGDGSHFGVEIEYTFEKEPLGTGGALSLLPAGRPKLPTIMINGDVLTDVDFNLLLDFYNSSNSVATVCVRNFEYEIPFGVVEQKNGLITAMTEKPKTTYSVNAGIYVLSSEVIDSVIENKRIDMPDVLQNYLNQGIAVSVFPLHEFWLDVGRPSDFEHAQKIGP